MIIEIATNYENNYTFTAVEVASVLELQSKIEEISDEVVSETELEILWSGEHGTFIYVSNITSELAQPMSWIFRKTTKEAYNARVMEEMQAKLLK
jgi:hypothetical protein|nr:MAG TPA: hypothetical protein [Caudoviricetes sp.]